MNKNIEYRGCHIEIIRDEDTESPRTWDNLGTMVCWHRRYDLGDKHDFATPADAWAHIQDTRSIVLPLYLYDHSGITMNTTGFPCPWDSGRVGYIYVEPKRVRKEYGCKIITPPIRKKVIDTLESEVKVYDGYLTGYVWGYRVKETGDSCFGYFGNPEHMVDDAKAAVDAYIAKHEASGRKEGLCSQGK